MKVRRAEIPRGKSERKKIFIGIDLVELKILIAFNRGFVFRYNMLGLAKRVKARFLLASTSEVYGSPEEHPQNEEYWGHVNCVGPRACYDEGKRVAETLTYSYARQDKVDVRVARIFNTFGRC